IVMESKPTKVRKLKPFEVLCEIAQSETIDILHLCIRKDDDEYWFYEMEEERIELQVLKDESPKEIFRKETHTSFNSSTGPLWRATFIPDNEAVKQVKQSNLFTSNLILTFNHAIVDGFTCFNICNSFLIVLNDVIGGKVQKTYDFGKLNDGLETEELKEQRMEFLNKNPEYLKEIKEFQTKFDSQKVRFNEFFPALEGAKKETNYIHGEIDEQTTKKLLKVFKSKGITFHSGFSSVLNWVIMELFTENGMTDEEIDLPSEHAINMRRYWKKSSTPQLGAHAAAVKIVSKTDKNFGSNFWEYAKDFGRTLKNNIDSMQGIDCNIQLTTSDFGESKVDFSKFLKNFPLPNVYYSSTNMGDLRSVLQGRGEYVSIKWITRGASVHCTNYMVTFIHTYEGRFLYNIGYSA
ncbi:hypothetical protein Avbf_15207, partial [Armadillidium vulgare]